MDKTPQKYVDPQTFEENIMNKKIKLYKAGYNLGLSDAKRGAADDSKRFKMLGKEFLDGYESGYYSIF